MAVESINARIYSGQYDFSGDANKVSAVTTYPEVDTTVFTNTATNKVGGLPSARLTAGGFANLGAALGHEGLRASVGVVDVPVSVAVGGGIVGTYAELAKSLALSYELGGQVGDVLPFTLEATGQGVIWVAGQVFVASGNKTASSNSGTAVNLGAVATGSRVYANLHVLNVPSGSSPTLIVTVKSDNAVGFPSAATQITFTTATGKTSEHKSTAGPITDSWWRVDWTIGGTATPTFDFVVTVGLF